MFNTLQIYLGSLYVNDFNLFGRTFRVTLQADKDARANPTDISRFYVRNATGGMVPLSTLGSLKPIVGPETVPHYNNYGSALINGGAAPGYSSGQAVAAMQRAAATALPRDFRLRMDRRDLAGAEGRFDGLADLRAGARLRVPDPGRAI